jgi:hypothetical protein
MAEVDAFAADVNVVRSFDERTDFTIAFSTERAVGVLLTSRTALARAYIFSRRHLLSFNVADRTRK